MKVWTGNNAGDGGTDQRGCMAFAQSGHARFTSAGLLSSASCCALLDRAPWILLNRPSNEAHTLSSLPSLCWFVLSSLGRSALLSHDPYKLPFSPQRLSFREKMLRTALLTSSESYQAQLEQSNKATAGLPSTLLVLGECQGCRPPCLIPKGEARSCNYRR